MPLMGPGHGPPSGQSLTTVTVLLRVCMCNINIQGSARFASYPTTSCTSNGARAAPEEPKTLNPSTPHHATAKRPNIPLFPSGTSHLGLSRTSLITQFLQMTAAASRPTPLFTCPSSCPESRHAAGESLESRPVDPGRLLLSRRHTTPPGQHIPTARQRPAL